MKAMALVSTLVLVALMGCKSSDKKVEADNGATWTGTMQNMADSLGNLLSLSLDPVAFNSAENQQLIDTELNRLAQFSHDVAAMKKKPSDDPSMPVVARQFSAEMQEARRQLQLGNRSFARMMIKNTTGYCVSCHSQTDRGPQFHFTGSSALAKLNALDRANFLFAVRRFDEGLVEFKKAMDTPDLALYPFSVLENVTIKALAVSVRVKQDPMLAESIINFMVQSKWAPVYLQISAMKWRGSIQEWQKSKGKAKTLADAKALVAKAWKKQMESPLARAGLIEYLRASALLHQLLSDRKAGKTYAETLYYAGLTSEALKDLDASDLSESYYEACIRHLPQSETARNCYLRLEGLSIANYSQFDSAPMPADMRQHLDELKKLAEPKENTWREWGDHR